MSKERLAHIREVISNGLDPIKGPLVHPTAHIDSSCVDIGEGCIVGPLACIGWFSVGAEWDEKGRVVRFPQYGKISIKNNVTVGPNAIIDRATNNDNLTEIGNRCMIAGGAHVGHNTKIGEDTLILGNTMISGSCNIGSNCSIGPSAALGDHITVGNNSIVGRDAVVTKNIPAGEVWVGNPARKLKNNLETFI